MASYTDVDSSSIISSIRDNFRAALEDVLDDPTHQEKRHWIYERPPHVAGTDFEGYPVVYIEDYDSDSTAETVNGYHTDWDGMFEVTVDVKEENPDTLDDLSDTLIQAFKSNSSQRSSLDERGIFKPDIDSSPRIVGINEQDEWILRRNFEISFNMRVDMG